MQKHIAVGLMQVISASIAGGLLGDTIPHAVGIFCALYALAPIVYREERMKTGNFPGKRNTRRLKAIAGLKTSSS